MPKKIPDQIGEYAYELYSMLDLKEFPWFKPVYSFREIAQKCQEKARELGIDGFSITHNTIYSMATRNKWNMKREELWLTVMAKMDEHDKEIQDLNKLHKIIRQRITMIEMDLKFVKDVKKILKI
jgi:hypothetical protein